MATKKQAAAAATALYNVISPLEYNGDRYDVGDQVEMSAADAAPLLGNTVQPAPATDASTGAQ